MKERGKGVREGISAGPVERGSAVWWVASSEMRDSRKQHAEQMKPGLRRSSSVGRGNV